MVILKHEHMNGCSYDKHNCSDKGIALSSYEELNNGRERKEEHIRMWPRPQS